MNLLQFVWNEQKSMKIYAALEKWKTEEPQLQFQCLSNLFRFGIQSFTLLVEFLILYQGTVALTKTKCFHCEASIFWNRMGQLRATDKAELLSQNKIEKNLPLDHAIYDSSLTLFLILSGCLWQALWRGLGGRSCFCCGCATCGGVPQHKTTGGLVPQDVLSFYIMFCWRMGRILGRGASITGRWNQLSKFSLSGKIPGACPNTESYHSKTLLCLLLQPLDLWLKCKLHHYYQIKKKPTSPLKLYHFKL